MCSSRPGKEGDENSMPFPFFSERKEIKETALPGKPQTIIIANSFWGTAFNSLGKGYRLMANVRHLQDPAKARQV